MNLKTDIYLNQLAQKIKPISAGIEWFENLSLNNQPDILHKLVYFIVQAGAIGKDVNPAIKDSHLKNTFTPCQLLLMASKDDLDGNQILRVSFSKVINLPPSEKAKSFILLVSLFSIADKRKRLKGLYPEKYWWHKDLSDEFVVQEILRDNEESRLSSVIDQCDKHLDDSCQHLNSARQELDKLKKQV